MLAAVVAAGAGVLIWNGTVADDGDGVIQLDEPGEYIDPAMSNPPNDGAQLPDIELIDDEGSAVRLVPDGRPMVVNLWYSNCPPCARELTYFAAVESDVGDEVRFIGVNPLDDADEMRRFAADRGVDYELLLDHDGKLDRGAGHRAVSRDVVRDGRRRDRRPTGSAQRGRAPPARRRAAGVIAGALDSNVLGLAFLRGMVASINPCGFVLLPTYLLFFLGVQAAEQAGDQRASVRRALVVGSAVSAGFVAVFLVVGIVTETIDTWLLSNAKYATVAIGVAFICLGVAMLAGYRPRFATPHLDAGGRTRSVGSMFVYGIAYAVASLGCTMPLFIPTVVRHRSTRGFRRRRRQCRLLRRRDGARRDRPHRQPRRRQPVAARRVAFGDAVRRPHRRRLPRAVGGLPALLLRSRRRRRGQHVDHRLRRPVPNAAEHCAGRPMGATSPSCSPRWSAPLSCSSPAGHDRARCRTGQRSRCDGDSATARRNRHAAARRRRWRWNRGADGQAGCRRGVRRWDVRVPRRRRGQRRRRAEIAALVSGLDDHAASTAPRPAEPAVSPTG